MSVFHLQDILRPDFSWISLFETFPHTKTYVQFVKICLSLPEQESLGQWVGWVKSRFRSLLVKLEDLLGFCDPSSKEYGDSNVVEPNVVFYWGLQPFREVIDLEGVNEEFMKSIRNGYQGPFGRMKLTVVKASQVPRTYTYRTGAGGSNSNNNKGGGGGGGKPHWRILRKIPEPEKNSNATIAACETAGLSSPRLQAVV